MLKNLTAKEKHRNKEEMKEAILDLLEKYKSGLVDGDIKEKLGVKKNTGQERTYHKTTKELYEKKEIEFIKKGLPDERRKVYHLPKYTDLAIEKWIEREKVKIDFKPVIWALIKDVECLDEFFTPTTPPKLRIPAISLRYERKALYPIFKRYIRDLLEKDPTLFKDPFEEIDELKKMELNFYKLRRNITDEISSVIKGKYSQIAKNEDGRLCLIEILSLRLKVDIIGEKYNLLPNDNVKKTSDEEKKIFVDEWVKTNPENVKAFLNDDVIKFLLKKTLEKNNIYEKLLKEVKKSPHINERAIKELWLMASNAQKRISNISTFLELLPQIEGFS